MGTPGGKYEEGTYIAGVQETALWYSTRECCCSLRNDRGEACGQGGGARGGGDGEGATAASSVSLSSWQGLFSLSLTLSHSSSFFFLQSSGVGFFFRKFRVLNRSVLLDKFSH